MHKGGGQIVRRLLTFVYCIAVTIYDFIALDYKSALTISSVCIPREPFTKTASPPVRVA